MSKLDLSKLTAEKRAFLKANPNMLASLEAEVPKQTEKLKRRKISMYRGKSKMQRDLDEEIRQVRAKADGLRHKYMLDPELRRINENFRMNIVAAAKQLVCPVCGDIDRGNRNNGRPWCFKCNSPLMRKDKVKTWKKQARSRVLSKLEVRDEINRVLQPGLNPKEEEKK